MGDKTSAKMTSAERKRWRELTRSGNGSAAVSSKADMKLCESLEKRGLAECYDSMFGYHYYSLTQAGERQIFR